MNYSIREMPNAHVYSETQYGNPGEGGKGVFIGERLMAYAWFDVEESQGRNIMDLQMIEVIDKEKGSGTEIIHFFFKHYQLDAIEGSIMLESSMRAYYFWTSLGADCDVDDEDEYFTMYEQGFDVTFTLERDAVEKVTVLKGE